MKTKNIILSVLVGLIVVALVTFKVIQANNPGLLADKLNVDTTAITNSFSDGTTPQASNIDIKVQQPIGATRKGVIEVGASGFNSFVVDVDSDGNWELIDKQFGESLAYEGFMSIDDVKLGLKKYLSTMFEKGVAGKNAHFVVSSGALKNSKTSLIIKGIESMGYVVNKVTAEEEGKYALKALLPKAYKDNSYTVDIGSGNTKVSWYTGNKLNSIESFGAKYYQNGTSEADVIREIKAAVEKVPAAQRQHCFIIGGVPFKLASMGKTEGRFQLLDKPSTYEANANEKIKSGLTIYKALYDSSIYGDTNSKFVFDWDANFTIGFLLSL